MHSHNFWFSVLQACSRRGSCFFLLLGNFQVANFFNLWNFAGCEISQPANNLQNFLSQPFNGHLKAIN